MPALFKSSYTGTSIQDSHKSNRVWLQTFCFIHWNSCNAFCSCPHFTYPNKMAVQDTTSHEVIFMNTLKASSILPLLAYISTMLVPINTSDSQPIWIICLWTCLPSSSACKLANALRTWTNMNLFGFMPSCCICWKTSVVFSYSGATELARLLFHEKLSSIRSLVQLQPSPLPPKRVSVGHWTIVLLCNHMLEIWVP